MGVRPSIIALEDSPIIEVWRMGFTTPGVIGLWAGESDLPTPAFIADAAIAGLRDGLTFYTQNRGLPALRAELAAYLERLYGVRIADDRLAITASGMSAVVLVAQALVEAGDNAVVITPSWPNIMRAVTVAGGEVRTVELSSGPDGWALDLDRVFAACDGRTRLIYYASPGNPTGWMLEREPMAALLAFARARGIHLLADEVYHRLVYDRPVAPSLLELAEAGDPAFVINSFSKAWAMTGWRMGWIVYPDGLTDVFEKLIQFNNSGGQAFLQMGAIAALRDGEPFVQSFVERCRAGRDQVVARLGDMGRVHLVPNAASFYVMFAVDGEPNTLAFCKRAVTEAGVGLAPGMAFGGGADDQIRLCYARATDKLGEAMDRLDRFLRA